MKRDLSIVIPAYNEARFISEGLASIRDNLRGIDHEIIVVDNGSTDATAELASKFPNVRVISITKSTISRARNKGVEITTGQLLAFLDGDVKITAKWATAISKKMPAVRMGNDYFGGFPFDIPENASLIERAWFPASSLGRLTYVGSANLIVSASVFRKINGFDESLRTAEDVDFGRRATRAGQVIDFDPEFHAIHLGFPRTIRHFFKREMWHGQENFRSFSRFVDSKVSVAAMVSAGLVTAGVLMLITGHTGAGLALLGLYLLMPLLYVIYRLQFRNLKYFPVQYFLAQIYLGARAVSGISSIAKLSLSGHRSS